MGYACNPDSLMRYGVHNSVRDPPVALRIVIGSEQVENDDLIIKGDLRKNLYVYVWLNFKYEEDISLLLLLNVSGRILIDVLLKSLRLSLYEPLISYN